MQLKMDKSDVLTNDCYSEVARIVGQELDAMSSQNIIDAITGVMDDDDDNLQSLESEDDSGSEALPQLVSSEPEHATPAIPKRDILGAPRNTETLQGTPDTALLPEGGLDQQTSTEQDDTVQFIEVEFT